MSGENRAAERLLVVTDRRDICIEAARLFNRSQLCADCTCSFDDALLLVANVRYHAVVVQVRRESLESPERLRSITELLRLAAGRWVALLTAPDVPDGALGVIRDCVSLYYHEATPLEEVVEAIQFLLSSGARASDRRARGRVSGEMRLGG